MKELILKSVYLCQNLARVYGSRSHGVAYLPTVLKLANPAPTAWTRRYGIYYCLSNAIHCMGQNIKSLAACVCVSFWVCVRTGFWTRISRKRLEIEPRYQYTTNRKGPMGNRLITWSMTSRDLERSRSWPQNIWGNYLENGYRYSLGYNRSPIGNGMLGIKWSHDRWRHVTLKGQGCDPDIFRCKYLENAWR